MTGLSTSLSRQLGLTKSSGRQIVRSDGELTGVVNAHALRRAWERIGLSAILFVDGKPTVLFKELQQVRESDLRRYHRFVWNQGIATLLVVSTPTEVLVFSGQAPPANDGADVSDNHRLVEQLHRVNDALAVEQLVYRIETGHFYESHPDSFDHEHAVDQYLLRNLGEVALQLHRVNRKLSLSRIHSLLGRTIFVCYLVDRNIIGADFFADAGAREVASLAEMFDRLAAPQAVAVLYRLFAMLQGKFNGSLFDEDLADEQSKIDERHVEYLKRFLNGDDLGSGQTTLGFWAYDFNFIPIETISAIYEEFLGVESHVGQTAANTFQRKSGAYYTPKHLAELVLDTATEGRTDILNTKTLDPACGSGVFLVSMFNRMAEQWRTENPNRRSNTRWRALVDILQTRVFGIDKNETACRIACFSLYLALLDQFSPRDIRELAEEGKLLPALLLKKDELPEAESPRTILCRNFFQEDLSDELDEFDLIIGNPPWIGRKQPGDPLAESWYRMNVKRELPSRQVAHAFMWKCSEHVEKNGIVCLLLPSKVFVNKTDDFQKHWFQHHRVEEVLQLADLRFILFKHAICPAVAVRYGVADATRDDYRFSYVCPQATRNDPRRGAISVYDEDRERVSTKLLGHFASHGQVPVFWKMHLRGSRRDTRFIDRLLSYPTLALLVGEPESNRPWAIGQGFKPGKTDGTEENPKCPSWSQQDLFLDANKKFNFLLSRDEVAPIGDRFPVLHRLPNETLFHGPMVLVTQGYTKIAYCDFNVYFRSSIHSISGGEDDRPNLKFLCAYLRSRLGRFFLFHTAAYWGVERKKVLENEYLQLPFYLPGHELAHPNATQIVRRVCSIFDETAAKLGNNGLKDRERAIRQADLRIEPLIFEYFDCDEYEQMLVRDTCDIIEPSVTPTSLDNDIPTLRCPTSDQRMTYITTLAGVLNSWGSRSPIALSARSVVSLATGLGVIALNQHERGKSNQVSLTDEAADDEVFAVLASLKDHLRRENGMRTYMRGVTIFDGTKAYIVKPLALRFWTETAALNDADSIAAVILNSKRKSR